MISKMYLSRFPPEQSEVCPMSLALERVGQHEFNAYKRREHEDAHHVMDLDEGDPRSPTQFLFRSIFFVNLSDLASTSPFRHQDEIVEELHLHL